MFPMPEAELVAIGRAACAFREAWGRVTSPPFAAAFDFTRRDVEAIDYMDYEGLAFPECGTDGAVLIVAEVVRRAAGVGWFMSYRGEWVLAEKGDFGGVAVAPRARFHEYECGRGTQDGNYLDLMAELALECVGAEGGEGVLALFPEGSEYFERLRKRLDRMGERRG
jgi:hypothetical protein